MEGRVANKRSEQFIMFTRPAPYHPRPPGEPGRHAGGSIGLPAGQKCRLKTAQPAAEPCFYRTRPGLELDLLLETQPGIFPTPQ